LWLRPEPGCHRSPVSLAQRTCYRLSTNRAMASAEFAYADRCRV
jgi:hypothetical protein